MWSCHKCGKPVYFAERKQSIGFDWHPDCLRCEECGKVLKPGQHAEHKGVPYCHVPCYGALFGPQLFGHGTRVESHSSFGKVENKSYGGISRAQLDSKLKAYNQHSENKNGGLKCREVNGRAVLEGVLKVYWGINSTIHLKEDDDQRVFVAVRKKTYRRAVSNGADFEHISFCDSDSDEDVPPSQNTEVTPSNASVTSEPSPVTDSMAQNIPDTPKYLTVPSKLEPKDLQWDELDELLQVERKLKDHEKPYQTLPPTIGLNISATYNAKESESLSTPEDVSTAATGTEGHNGTTAKDGDVSSSADDVVNKNDSPSSSKSTAIRRRPGRRFDKAKLKRRCSINGHYYNRETSVFTPPYGSLMTVWATSLVNTQEVIKILLEKYRVESQASNFAIYIVKDNGERKKLREDESPLLTRVILGPHEDVARLFLVDAEATAEISPAVAQFIRFSQAECQAILDKYAEEEEREAANIRARYKELRRRIRKRMQDLKVKL